nr:hypothetical protein [Tanacetum cinerariifolium]
LPARGPRTFLAGQGTRAAATAQPAPERRGHQPDARPQGPEDPGQLGRVDSGAGSRTRRPGKG